MNDQSRPPFSGDGEPLAPAVDRTSGRGQSEGVPAKGLSDRTSFSPTGGPGALHWQEGTITSPGLDDRGDVFFAAIEMTRMPMILTDPNKADNPIAFANRAFLDLTGYSEDEVVGRNCRFLQGAQTSAETVTELRDAVAAKRAISTEILNYKRDGSPFWNAVFIGPVYSRDGELLYFFASQLDVTRRRTSEQAFRQAQKMEAIGQLTAGLAHDFNNLLQVVEGNLEIIADDAMTDRQRRSVETALRSLERGSRLTRQLLAFARKTRLEPKPTNLNALFIEFGDMLESTLGNGVELVLNLRQRLPACLVDPTHLEMALLNVLINARDAMGARGGVVTASTELVRVNGDAEGHQLPPGEYVALSIRDEGPGMLPLVLERATEPFFTTKEVGKGTGLGLAMVQGFVQQSRGRLEIDSKVGRGTTVRMLFPTTAQAEALAKAQPRSAEPDLARELPQGRAETILVVEDSDDVLDLARGHLTKLGYTVLVARSGEEAVAAYDAVEGRIDLLFTDIAMPGGMNGLVLASTLRERAPGLPVLLTTGYNDELVTEGPGAPGMDVLGKPYRRSELADRIRAALNQAGARRARGEIVESPRRQPRQPNPAAEA
jgi:PAS domain S-box-containing protein